MQTRLLPSASLPGSALPFAAEPRSLLHCMLNKNNNLSRDRRSYDGGCSPCLVPSLPTSLSAVSVSVSSSSSTVFHSPSISLSSLVREGRRLKFSPVASAPAASPLFPDDTDQAKLAQVAKRLESTARYFNKLGSFGFWSQLISTVVSAVILSFSIVVTGKITSPFTFYSTAAGIAAAFISVFWSFGYLRLAERLRRTANDPSKAPARADVVKGLKNGIIVNLLGMGAAVLGMQGTVGLLVAKALTTSATPYYQGVSPGSSPVLALDVFLVQASANTILSHFLGLASSLELLRSVTLSPTGPAPVPKVT